MTDAGRRNAGTRAILDSLLEGAPDQPLHLHQLLSGLGRRTFGMLLLIATLPAFIPIPGVGGAIGGPLCMLVGLQLLLGLREPWLPDAIARRSLKRDRLARFDQRIAPWLSRLEYLVRPRLSGVLDLRIAVLLTGLQLLLLGILLALPIPFTNYLFGGLLLCYALALLERDGLLMLLCWIAGIGTITVFGVLSGRLTELAAHWLGALQA